MDTKFFFFFLFFLLILTIGCIDFADRIRTSEDEIVKGGISAELLINGVPTGDSLNLISEQKVTMILKLKNVGERPIENVNAVIFGLFESEEEEFEGITLNPGEIYYLTWDMEAEKVRRGENLRGPTIFQVCFEQTAESYIQIITIPEDYRDTIPTPHSHTSSDYLNIRYRLNPTKIIEDSKQNIIYGDITVTNKGFGDIDYLDYTGNLSINILKEVRINTSRMGDKFQNTDIVNYAWRNREQLQPYLENNNLIINNEEIKSVDEFQFLRLIRGRELNSRIMLNVTDPENFQDTIEVGIIDIEIDHGYCIRIATINTVISGR